jgi:hypothetical protein
MWPWKKILLVAGVVYMLAIGYLVFFYISGDEEPAVTAPEKMPEAKKPSQAPKQKLVLEEMEPEKTLSDAEVEEIKMEVVSGKRTDIPQELNTSAEDIVKFYLRDCNTKSGQEGIECFEYYYENTDEEYVQEKNECLDETGCLDNFYYSQADEKHKVFCDAIDNSTLKDECKNTIE